MANEKTIPHQDITYEIIGAAMRVHNQLGPGHKERVYQRGLTAEMRSRGLDVKEEYPFALLREDGTLLGYLILDHLVEDAVIVEDKAFSHLLTNEEVAQVICYLAATTLPVGLLLNFGRKKLEFRRILPPTKLSGWENRIIRYLWRPEDPEAAATHFTRRGIEPKEIVLPSQLLSAPSAHPLHPSAHPLDESADRSSVPSATPSAHPLRRRQSADRSSADHSSVLNELFAVIRDRRENPPPEGSYTARLFAAGATEIAKKVGEEAIEVIVAAAENDTDQIVYEAADLVYHLLVLLAHHDIDIEALYAELKRRRK